jgi:hypothetical protein
MRSDRCDLKGRSAKRPQRLICAALISVGCVRMALALSAGTGLDVVPTFAVALAGLALTLSGAMLLEWLPRDIHLDGPLPCENVLMARLPALQEIVTGSAWRGGTQWVVKLPSGGALTKTASNPHSCSVA